MYSTAKGYFSRRKPAIGLGTSNRNTNNNSDEKKEDTKVEEKKSYGIGDFFSDMWNNALQTRNFNRIQASKGEAPFYTPPGTELVQSIDAAIGDTLGISDASAKAFNEALQDGIDEVIAGVPVTDAVKNGINSFNNSVNASHSGASAKPIIYSDWTPVSKLFGMNQETAFGEHMANTAHQREVADLKAAGLNPVLGISGSGATSVSGSTGASSSAEKVQDNSMLDVLGATAAVITAVATKNPMYGYMVSNIFKAFE